MNETPCLAYGGTGQRWDKDRDDWGKGNWPYLRREGDLMNLDKLFQPGQAVIFREMSTSRSESGVIVEALPADEGHPNGGEYIVSFEGNDSVIAWFDELNPA